MQAAATTPDSTESSSRRGRSGRRVKTAVTSAGSGRVLRARGAVSCSPEESKDTQCKEKSPSPLRGRGKPAGVSCKDTPVQKLTVKKLAAKNASKDSLEAKLFASKGGKGRPPSAALCTSSAAECKPGAETDSSSCGEEKDAFTESNNNFSDPDASLDDHISFRDDLNDLTFEPDSSMIGSRLCETLQKEVKTEEEEDIKEESTEVSVQSEDEEGDITEPSRKRRRRPRDHDDSSPRKKRKKPPAQYVRCDIEGCGAVLAHPRYLQHHIKYQHLLKKIYRCDYPACGRLFRLQKQLLRHAKHHTDQRDFICEFCARAFKSAHNLTVHKMIHTGEKPIQCEICGFTCRQKASLNWHMKKHDAAASYQFSCSVCDKKFEKKDSVVAHMTKSHPSVLIAEALEASGGKVISNPVTVQETAPVPTPSDTPSDSKESQEVEGGTRTLVENVEPPLVSQPQIEPPLPPQPQIEPPLPLQPQVKPLPSPQPQMKPPLPPQPQMKLPLPPQPQIKLPLPPQPQLKLPLPRLRPMKPRMNAPQHPLLQPPTHHVLQVAHQPQPPAVLHLTASPTHLSGTQFIQLSTLPISTITAMPAANHHSNLITLSPVSALTSTASVAPQQGAQWKKEAQEDAHVPGEGELWDRVVVGSEEMMWEGIEAKREVDEESSWEREGERHFFTGC